MKTYHLAVTCILLITFIAIPFQLQAQQHSIPSIQDQRELQGKLLERLNTASRDDEEHPETPHIRERDRLSVMVELEDLSTTQVFAAVQSADTTLQATTAAQDQLARIEGAQQDLLRSIAALDTTVLYRLQRVYNGIALQVDASKLVELARLPGVKAVHPLQHHYRDHTTSVPLIGAPGVWEQVGAGITGTGLKIGIIDSGIDYLHANFGGSGNTADFVANDTTVITDQLSIDYFGAGKKVVGGYDFVGDSYNSNPSNPDTYQPIPQPDPDPMDCDGHGSHVAGTVAGLGVNADGTTHAGPYNAQLPFDNLRIGPGVAPGADLYALRIFGCDGSTQVTAKAIEWAVDPNGDGSFDDRLDVINMSLGSSFGDPSDTTAVASDNAAKAGVVVVASAGNSEDSYYVIGSPSVSSHAISVAGSSDSSAVLDGFRVNAPSQVAAVYAADFSSQFNWAASQPVTGTLVYPASQNTGCEAFTPANAGLISGNIVLLDWSEESNCGSSTRVGNAARAGAIGAIIADNVTLFGLRIAGSRQIPAVSTAQDVGTTLKTALQSGPVEITLSSEYANQIRYVDESMVDTILSATSLGPRSGDSLLKPDLTAPGATIFSAAVGTGNQGASLSGTSMAAPHVAGMMALLRQIHPDWSVQELKALTMNTATKNVYSGLNQTGIPFGPSRVGAGRVNLPKAGQSGVILYNTERPELVSLSFGSLEVPSTMTMTKSVTIMNKGVRSVRYNLVYVPSISISGVSYTLSKDLVILPAGASTTVDVTLTADPSLMRHTRDPLVSETQLGIPRHYINEASGYIALYTTSPVTFSAQLNGDHETPPANSLVTGSGIFTYTAATGQLAYRIDFSDNVTVGGSGAHLHNAPAGSNGPIAISLVGGNKPDEIFGPGKPLQGIVTLDKATQAPLLRRSSLYVNIATAANPTGEIRGQIVPTAEPDLRLPVHTVARAVSDMQAQSDVLIVGSNITGTSSIRLAGSGLQDQADLGNLDMPVERLSLVSAFELQIDSPQASTPIGPNADLQYVGIASDFWSTITPVTPTGMISATNLYFGIATYGNWTTPVDRSQEFSIYIDTDGSGIGDAFVGAEYRLFNTTLYDGSDPTNVFITALKDLATGKTTRLAPINIVDADVDTAPFNNSVLIMPVPAGQLGLQNNNSTISYQVATEDRAENVDLSQVVTYTITQPGVAFREALIGSVYADLPGRTITVMFDQAALRRNDSQGVLLLHHHNATGRRAEVITPGNAPEQNIFVPFIRR